MALHAKFIGRTVMVKDGNVDGALRILNRLLGREDIIGQYRRTRYYEKPFLVRRRVNYTKVKSVAHEDLTNKMNLVLRKNRINPYPGAS